MSPSISQDVDAGVIRTRITAAVFAGLALVACGGPASGEREILVSAAASLTDAFAELEAAYEGANPDADVVLNLAGSSALREQILEGAPVDVFAPADPSIMDQVVAAGRTDTDPQVFAINELQIAVPRGNPAGITGLEDFSDGELLIGLCADEVPCGSLARRALAGADVTPAIDTNESDVRALLTKLEAGELDAGITYATDVAASGGAVEGIEIPAQLNATVEYPIAVLDPAPNRRDAEMFVTFVLSEEGRAILMRYGFDSP